MKYILGLLFVIQIIYPAPLSFGAGDLSQKKPYGLSSNEKFILNNKTSIEKLQINDIKQKQISQDIKNSINVLKEMFVSSSTSNNQEKNDFNKIFSSINEKIKNILVNAEYQDNELEKLKQNIELLNNANKILKTTLFGLKDIILEINNNFVSKEELEVIKKSIVAKKEKKLSPKDVQQKADKLYKNKKYVQASKNYKILLNKKYRPARSNFKLGEISYYQKKYKKSIQYYTKSVGLYDKAKYMPTLLYHTAISYIKLNDKKNAKAFLNAIIKNFPKSKEAKLAKKEL